MNINISEKAKNKLDARKFKDFEYTALEMTSVGWAGPIMALVGLNKIDEEKYSVIEDGSYKFAIPKRLADIYTNVNIDYVKNLFMDDFRIWASH